MAEVVAIEAFLCFCSTNVVQNYVKESLLYDRIRNGIRTTKYNGSSIVKEVYFFLVNARFGIGYFNYQNVCQ